MEARKTVDTYLASLDPSQAAILSAIRGLIRDAVPDLREAFKWAQPIWEINGPVCYLKAYRASTNFGFWRGVEVEERAGAGIHLLGDGIKMRHIKLLTVSDVQSERLIKLLRTAVELNQRFGDPTKGEEMRAT